MVHAPIRWFYSPKNSIDSSNDAFYNDELDGEYRESTMVDMKAGDSAALQGVQVDDNDLISHDDSSNHRMIGTNSDTQVDNVS